MKEEAESQSNGMSYNFNKEVKTGVLRLCSGRQKQRKFWWQLSFTSEDPQ